MKLKIHPDADTELDEAFDYYERQVPGLGAKFVDQFVRGSRAIVATPERFPAEPAELGRSLHRYRLKRFPYVLIYQIRSDHLLLLAVMHCHRRPGYWSHRVR